jgi:predicted O-methyltransferase YrrM
MKEDSYISLPKNLIRIETDTQFLGFDMPSERNTGSLLRTLCASKPSGNFLEIGTGTGLATAWILEGMDDNSRLVTMDNDGKALAIARQYLSADPRVELLECDASFWLQQNQGQNFDLIFADTYPGKYEHFDLAWTILKPGGIYMIDDMLPQANWPKGHEAKVRGLLDHLSTRVDLKMSKMDWASGLVLAVKST